ncbi:MAG: hypothetical protein HQK87_07230 [Nitrospinae bacterium]|nr:hypothetical protein [Nitrospinota bacterium]
MRTVHLCIAALTLLAAAKAFGVLPPLDDEDKLFQSTHIIEGTVEKADARIEADRLGTRWVTTLTLTVDAVLKGDDLSPGSTIAVAYWQAGKRPDRWVGDTGQRGSFGVGMRRRLFMRATGAGYRLLSPDGSESLAERPRFPYRELREKGWRMFVPTAWTDEPAPIGRGNILWPPEGETPTMSHVSVEPYADACGGAGLLERTRTEVKGYLAGEIVRESGGRPGEPYDIEYRWKDEPGQTTPFVNVDRFVCSDAVGWRLRFASTDEEYPAFIDAARIMFRSFTGEP